MAQAVQELHPDARLGIGPPIENGFYYDFDVETPFTPDDLAAHREADAADRQGGPVLRPPRGRRRRGARRAGRRALQARADRPQGRRRRERRRRGRRRGRRRRADHLRQRAQGRVAGLEGPLPRAAPADHPAHPGVQADAVGGRLLAGEREEPAAAAHLRHRVGDPGRAEGLPAAAGRGREARPPQARRRARPLLLPGRDRLRPRRVPPQGRRDPAGDGGLRPAAARARRASSSSRTPHISKEGLFETSGAPAVLRRRHVPADGDGGRGLLPQGHELPDAQPDLPLRAAGPTASCRCGCSSSAPSTATRSPGSCTA